MQFFTWKLYLGLQRSGAAEQRAKRGWDRNSVAYVKQLRKLRWRLSPRGWEFFSRHCLHDGILIHCAAGDWLGKADVDPSQRRMMYRQRRTSVEMNVLSNLGDPRIYVLRYDGVEEFEVRQQKPKWESGASIFSDWIYDELVPEGRDLLRHNILFACGVEISIVFRRFGFRRSARGKVSGDNAARKPSG